MYKDRLEQIIAGILVELETLPPGPEQEELRRLLEEMRQIAAHRLDDNTVQEVT